MFNGRPTYILHSEGGESGPQSAPTDLKTVPFLPDVSTSHIVFKIKSSEFLAELFGELIGSG